MIKLHSISIRNQIIVLIILMTVLPLGIIVYTAVIQEQFDIDKSLALTSSVADHIRNDQKIMLAGAEQLAAAVSILPIVKHHDSAAVSSFLAQVLKTSTHCSNVIILDRTGSSWASAIPSGKGFSYSDRKYFKNVIASGKISSGEYTIGEIPLSANLSFAFPIKDQFGAVSDILVVVFSLDRYRQLYNGINPSSASSILLDDYKGKILYSSIDPTLVGKMDRVDIFTRMVNGRNEEVFEAVGNFGTRRIFTCRKLWLKGESAPYMYIRTGLNKDYVLAAAFKNIICSVGILLTIMLSLLGVAIWFYKRSILDQISALQDAARKIAHGDLTARVQNQISGGELDDLGRAFNDMAHRLQLSNTGQQESEKKYRELVENADSIILKLDPEGNVTFFNEFAERFFGFSESEIHGRNVVGTIVPETDSTGRNLSEMIKNIFVHPEEYSHSIYENVRKNGERVWISWNNHALVGSDGAETGCLSVGQDITERRSIEKELQKSEQRFRSFVENANDIVFALTPEGVLQYVSSNWKEALGYELEETIGHSFVLFVHPEDVPACMEFLKRTVETGKKQSGVEYRVPLKNGGQVWYRANGSITHDIDSGDTIFIGIGRDITELKTAEETLRQSEEKFSAAFRASPDAIILSRLSDGKILEVNEGFTALTGYLSEEAIGKTSLELNIWNSSEDRIHPLLEVNEFGIVDNKDFRFRRKDGSMRTGQGSARIIEINGVKCMLSISRDITERERLQNELVKAQKLESISVLAGGIAHNFNNVLTGVIGYISYAKKNLGDTDKVLQILDAAEKSSHRAAGLARQLLTFSQGDFSVRTPVSVEALIEESVSLFLSGSNVDGIITCPSHQTICADGLQISQAFNNIVLNALHAMPNGGTLAVSVEGITLDENSIYSLGSGNYVKIVFEDSGCGIEKEDLIKVYDPYFTTKEYGTGLGLSTTHSIITKNGGHIDIASEIGKGTRVTIILPSTPEEPVDDR